MWLPASKPEFAMIKDRLVGDEQLSASQPWTCALSVPRLCRCGRAKPMILLPVAQRHMWAPGL